MLFATTVVAMPSLHSHKLWPNEITCSKCRSSTFWRFTFIAVELIRFFFHFILKLCFVHSFSHFLACLFVNTKRIMVTCSWKSFQNCCSTLKLFRKENSKKTEFCLINLLNRGNELWVEYLFYDRMSTMLWDRNKTQRLRESVVW